MFLNDYNYIFSHGLSMFGCGKRDTNYSFSIFVHVGGGPYEGRACPKYPYVLC